MSTRVLIFLAAASLLVGCASDGATTTTEPTADATSPPTSGSGSGPGTEPACIADTFPSAPDFVGLDQEAAEELADERSLEVREVGRDGECFAVTEDLRQDRVNLEYRGDEVIGAAIY